jgi:hypothetical protein
MSGDGTSYAQIAYDEWAAAERRFMRSPQAWDDLSGTAQSSWGCAAIAVASTVRDAVLAAEPDPAESEGRWCLLELMGHRQCIGRLAEVTFAGRVMSVREARAAAITRRARDLSDDFNRGLPLLLDDLDAIRDDEIAAIRAEIGVLRAELEYAHGATGDPSETTQEPEPERAKPLPRRAAARRPKEQS